jgi:hypothetical protein
MEKITSQEEFIFYEVLKFLGTLIFITNITNDITLTSKLFIDQIYGFAGTWRI